jgi:Ca2+-binding RTX toxin-like protein
LATPGNPLLRAYLAGIAEPGSDVPARADFDMRTLRFIDRNGGLLSDELRSPEGRRLFDVLGLVNVERGGGGPDRMRGTGIADDLEGLVGADVLRGFAGADRLKGGRGDDALFAGAGADDLAGGLGRDRLWGDIGADTFRFGPGDTGAGRARDVIGDFQSGRDRIALAAIDADATLRGNQAFDFIGGARFSGDAGELRLRGGVLSADVDGDGRPDLQIELAEVTGLRGSDLLL